MIRSPFRHAPKLEALETREVLSGGGPSAQAQYMLELINSARTNPVAMADKITSNLDLDVSATVKHYKVDLDQVKTAIASSSRKQPLAWNDRLAAAAQKHSQDQANTGIQSHTGSDGSDNNIRIDREEYGKRASTGENAYAYAKSVDHAMKAFLIDWGVDSAGHRKNILQPDTADSGSYREVGIGIADSNRPGFGPKVITQDFGSRVGAKAQLLGVVFDDANRNDFYDAGEGRGGVVIDAENLATGRIASVESWDQGGYQVELDPGTYQVSARVGNQVVRSEKVEIGTQNIKVDYDLSDPWTGAPAGEVTVADPDSASDSTAQDKVLVTEGDDVTTKDLVETKSNETNESDKPYFDPSWLTSWTSWTARK